MGEECVLKDESVSPTRTQRHSPEVHNCGRSRTGFARGYLCPRQKVTL